MARSRESVKTQPVKAADACYIKLKEESIEESAKQIGDSDIIVEATGISSITFRAMSFFGTNGILVLTGVLPGSKKLEACSYCLNPKMVLGSQAVFGTVDASKSDLEAVVQDFGQFEAKSPNLLSCMTTKQTVLRPVQKVFFGRP